MHAESLPARERLIRDHALTARRIALRVARQYPAWIPREDLVAAGMLGLIEAADRYDDSRQEPFLAFAEHRIRGAILDEVRRGDIMPRRKRQLARRVAAAIRELEQAGESPSDDQIAEKLGVSVETYRDEIAHVTKVEVRSLDGESDVLAGTEVPPDVEANRRVTLERVRAQLGLLDARDATIIGLHFLEDQTFQEIATTLHITPSRVSQLMSRAMGRLRALLGAELAAAA